jgi:amino acid transporter
MKKLETAKNELARQLKAISISSTVIIHLLYIVYLRFALRKSIGNRMVNLALVLATGAFLVVYLAFQIFGKNKKNIKRTKKLYKQFKLLTKVFTVGTAVYTVITAVGSVSPTAALFATVNAVLLGIRLIFEVIISLISLGARKVKSSITEKRARRNGTSKVIETDEVPDVVLTLDDL